MSEGHRSGPVAGLAAAALAGTLSLSFTQMAEAQDGGPEDLSIDPVGNVLDGQFIAKEGRTFDGRLLHAGREKVTVRRADGAVFDLPKSVFYEPRTGNWLARFDVKGVVEPNPVKSLPEGMYEAGVEPLIYRRTERRSYREVDREHSIPLLLYRPEGADQRRPLPLLLFLHGTGGCGTDGIRPWTDGGGAVQLLMREDFQKAFPCYVLIPQSNDAKTVWTQSSLREPSPELLLSVQAIDALKATTDPGIDMHGLYATGLSAGGHGAFCCMVQFPGKFAATVPVAADFDWVAFNGENARPTWMVFNARDPTVHPETVEELAVRFKALGVDMVQRPIPVRGGHDAWSQAYGDADFRLWLRRQSLRVLTYPSDPKEYFEK